MALWVSALECRTALIAPTRTLQEVQQEWLDGRRRERAAGAMHSGSLATRCASHISTMLGIAGLQERERPEASRDPVRNAAGLATIGVPARGGTSAHARGGTERREWCEVSQ